jgi:hypothetical protein
VGQLHRSGKGGIGSSEGGIGSREGGVMTLLLREQLRQVLTFQQIFQWCKAVKVHHAQKPLQILDSVRPRKV